MNAAQTKLLTWSAAGALGVGLALYVGWFVSRLDQVQQRVTKEQMKSYLENVVEIVPRADDIVAYQTVEAAVINLNWTGRPAPKDPVAAQEPTAPRPSEIPVDRLVKVMWISFDEDAPPASKCVLNYTPEAQVRSQPNATGALPGWIKMPGDALDDPLGHVSVHAIHRDGVEFAFSDEAREHELVRPGEYDLRGLLVLSNESELVIRRQSIPVPRAAVGVPVAKTTLLNDGIYQIGYEDAEFLDQNYSDVLANEVRWSTHRDPRSGRPDGIQVLEVKPDSIAAVHGVSTGDVIKSINGHPVTSTSEAISFVKNNKDLYDKWEVVVLSKGREKTLVYYPPNK